MVHRKTRQSSSIISQIGIFAALLSILVIALGVIIGIFAKSLFTQENNEPADDIINSTQVQPTTPTISEPPMIDFQSVIDEWVSSVSGNSSILIYDLDKNKIIGEHNTNEDYGTASLYKLFVVYEGYRRLESGEWQANSAAGNTGYTILECLDLAIRESNSPCAETLWSMIGHAELDKIIINDLNIKNSNISYLTSNPRDILAIMQLFYQHPDIKTPTYINRIKDSFLNQPVTTYNWRQGLPSGFRQAKVYNKVGWEYNPAGYWNIYHDAAIIEFPAEDRHFIVVIMTNRIPFEKISELGSKIENHFLVSTKEL